MAPKATQSSLFQSPKILAYCLSLLGTLIFTQIAIGAPPNGLGGTREFSQTEAADPAAGPVSVARIQSAAKKDVDEAVLQEKTSGTTTPPPPVPKTGGRVKKVRPLADSSSGKDEIRAVRGAGAGIQDEDSLSGGSSAKSAQPKGKAGAKEESF
jgi:hypothetical protein